MNSQFLRFKERLSDVGRCLFPGGVATLFVVGLLKLGVWQPLEQLAYNTLFRLRGPLPWDQRVVIVAIDELSLRQLGRFPLSRKYYTLLLQELTQAEASVVVLDVVFSESTSEDQALAKAIAEHGRVVLAQAWNSQGQSLTPTRTLQANAIASGHVLNSPDNDGVTRHIAPEIQGIPSLSIAAVQAYSLVQEPISLPKLRQPLWINWLGPLKQAPQYSLVNVLNGKIPIQTFQNKIVVVGATAGGLSNLFTPFDRNPPSSGVYLDATAIDNFLQQRFLRIPQKSWIAVMLAVAGFGLSPFLVYWSWGQRLIFLTGLCLGWTTLSLLLFYQGYWIPVASPLILLGLSTAIAEIYERLRMTARLRQDIQQLWKFYRQNQLVLATSIQSASLIQTNTTTPAAARNLAKEIPSTTTQPIVQLAELAEQIARAQAAYTAIARNLSIGLLAADQDEQVWFCNPVAADWLQIQLGDQLQTQLVPNWFSQSEWESSLQILQEQHFFRQELQRGDRWFELKLEPLLYQPALPVDPELPPQPTGFLLLLEEITLHRQAETEIRKALTREQDLNELKSRFITIISHEFRTPLTTIQSATELLEHYEWSTEARQERFQQIHTAVQHMTQLLEDVLVIGRAEVGNLEFRPTLLNPTNFCQELVAGFQLTTDRVHAITFTYPTESRLAWIDAKLLRQILNNLLSNAIKYSPEGGAVELEIQYGTDSVIFCVRDEGIGIPPEDLPHLFEHFHRADNVGNIAGTGLGLAIVKKSVELHQGRLSVQSQLDIGTEFQVVLPLDARGKNHQRAEV